MGRWCLGSEVDEDEDDAARYQQIWWGGARRVVARVSSMPGLEWWLRIWAGCRRIWSDRARGASQWAIAVRELHGRRRWWRWRFG